MALTRERGGGHRHRQRHSRRLRPILQKLAKYHRTNRPIQLTRGDVNRLLRLKERMKAGENDWMFPNKRKTGPIWHEDAPARVIQPMARKLNLPRITWRLIRHWGTSVMVDDRSVSIKAAQQRLGHSRPDILLKHYAHLLDESADQAAETLSSQLRAKTPKKQLKKARSGGSGQGNGSQTAANSKGWVM